jgi:hypothetical protein
LPFNRTFLVLDWSRSYRERDRILLRKQSL